MKQLSILFIVSWLSLRLTQVQDVVYLSDQTSVTGTLAGITAEKVSVRVPKGEAFIKFSYGLERVVAVVGRRGRFLCMNQLQALPADERDRLVAASMTRTDPLASDVIIRQNPSEAIHGQVSYDRGEVVNFTTTDSLASSLPKNALTVTRTSVNSKTGGSLNEYQLVNP